MTCRETPAGSALTSMARILQAGPGMERLVSDAHCLSILHEERRAYDEAVERGGWVSVTPENAATRYQEVLRRSRDHAESSRDLSAARRASIISRIDQAIANGVPQTPDGNPDCGLVSALDRIHERTRLSNDSLNRTLFQYQRRSGLPLGDVMRTFRDNQANAPRRGDARGDFPSDVEAAASRELSTQERGARYAMMRMEEETRSMELARVAARPDAIERTPVTRAARYTGIDGVEIESYGYNQHNQRLEVELSDGNVYAYHIPYHKRRYVESLLRENGDGAPIELGTIWAETFRGNDTYTYPSHHAQQLGGAASRCSACGQFASSTGGRQHACPPSENNTLLARGYRPRTSSQAVSIPERDRNGEETGEMADYRLQLPLVRDLRDAAQSEDGATLRIDTTVNDSSRYGARRVDGIATANLADDGTLTVDISDVRCWCQGRHMTSELQHAGTAPCPHRDAVEAAIRRRIVPPARQPLSEEERERRAAARQAAYEAAAASDWTRNEEGLAEARRTWQTADTQYSTDPEAFLQDWRDAEARAAKNGSDFTPVSYQRENALSGLGRREDGNGFGTEIEFTFPPGVDKAAALRQIGTELYEAGITNTERQRHYGASKQDGYRDTHTHPDTGRGTWSFERDCTVDGEIVTPVMYDEPETWDKLEKVCTILKRNGAVPSKKAGMHVHVGTKNYDGDVKKYTELARMVTQHQDVLYRAAADPQRGRHRGMQWAAAHTRAVPPEGFTTVSSGWTSEGTSASMWQGGRYQALNFAAVSGGASDHPEFRLFDSSLDPGTMQVQIKTAMGITAAAARNAESGGTTRSTEEVGSHHQRRGGSRRRLTDEELLQDTATMRSFVDTVFRDQDDKKQFLEVFSQNKWTTPDRRRRR